MEIHSSFDVSNEVAFSQFRRGVNLSFFSNKGSIFKEKNNGRNYDNYATCQHFRQEIYLSLGLIICLNSLLAIEPRGF